MEITFTDDQNETLVLNYPREFSGNTHLEERLTDAPTEWGQLRLKECWFEGACLLQSRFMVDKRSSVRLQCDSFCWLMNFVISGGITSVAGSEELQMEQGCYQTFYCQALDMQLQVEQPTETFTICLTRRFIRKLLGKDLLPEQFESGAPEPFTMVISDAYQHSRLATLLKEIAQAGQPPHIRRIYLEAKILELLSLQLESLEKNEHTPGDYSREDVVRLNEARHLVEQNLQTPCSLIELARKTGLNDFKLKRGFKTLFGHTVFGYLTELRMEKARQLLIEGSPVNEVAEMVGYKNAHHFTAAFKKRYQQLPSKLNI